jgi:hypothetical protein
MFERDEPWERRAAVDHARHLIDLLRKGQDVDADADGTGETLRAWFVLLTREIERATHQPPNVDLPTAVIAYLYRLREEAGLGVGAIDVSTLAHELGQTATPVAVVCSELAKRGLVENDGDLMGFVRLTDDGVRYREDLRAT